jgi:hypothetical protein
VNDREALWLAHQRQRWMLPDPSRWLQPDQSKWLQPDHSRFQPPQYHEQKYAPNQPRVPAGNPDGGEWTSGGGAATRLAASDKPSLGPGTMAAIAAQLAKRVIQAYRSENGLWDLFGHKDGTVAVTTINGSDIFGSNSNSPTYTNADRAEAEGLRNNLIENYPDILDADNVGRRPNDALFHAETNVLLRAARENGGTLAGRTLDVFVDNPMCPSCRRVLPYVD